MNLIEIVVLVLKISLLLTALAYGLKGSPADFLYVLRKPGQLLRSILAMNILMPAVAISMAVFLDLPKLVNVTLIALSVSPLAPIFPKKPLEAGGREAYVTGLMVAAGILSVILIPLTLEIIARAFHKPVAVDTKPIVVTILITVIIPMVVGFAIRHFAPNFTEKIINPLTIFSRVLLIAAVLPILFKTFPVFLQLLGDGTILAIVAFVVIGMLIGHLLGGPEKADRTVLALATASRHPAIAMTLANANLPDHKLVPATLLLYLLINAILALPYLKLIKKSKPEHTEPAS